MAAWPRPPARIGCGGPAASGAAGPPAARAGWGPGEVPLEGPGPEGPGHWQTGDPRVQLQYEIWEGGRRAGTTGDHREPAA